MIKNPLLNQIRYKIIHQAKLNTTENIRWHLSAGKTLPKSKYLWLQIRGYKKAELSVQQSPTKHPNPPDYEIYHPEQPHQFSRYSEYPPMD